MQTSPESPKQLSIFVSYAKEDHELYKALKNHLRLLERLKYIQIVACLSVARTRTERPPKLDQLNTAHIILLLISSDFIASDECYSVEMTQAMKRHYAGDAYVVPILLRALNIEGAPFVPLQPLPHNGIPVTEWENRDAAWQDVVEGIKLLVTERLRDPLRVESKAPPEDDFAWANELVQRKQYELALEAYERAIESSLLNTERICDAYIQRGMVLDNLERYEQSVDAYEQALKHISSDSPRYIDITIRKGWAHYRRGEYEKAITAYEDVIHFDEYDIYELKYYTLYRLKRYGETLEACKQAIRLDPDRASAYDAKSWVFYRLGYDCTDKTQKVKHYNDALEASKQALACDSKLTSAYNSEGRVHNQLGNYKQALVAYTKAIECYKDEIRKNPLSSYLHHKLATVYDNRGGAHSSLGNYQAALRSYTTAINFYRQAYNPKRRNALPLEAIFRLYPNFGAACLLRNTSKDS